MKVLFIEPIQTNFNRINAMAYVLLALGSAAANCRVLVRGFAV